MCGDGVMSTKYDENKHGSDGYGATPSRNSPSFAPDRHNDESLGETAPLLASSIRIPRVRLSPARKVLLIATMSAAGFLNVSL